MDEKNPYYKTYSARRSAILQSHSSPGKALIQAALSGSLDDVQILLKNGANPNVMVSEFYNVNHACSLLYLIARKGYQPMVKILLAAGAELTIESEKSAPMLLAAQNSAIATQKLKVQLAKNPDVNQLVDEEKNTPLTLALKLGQYDLAVTLVEGGAKWWMEDIYENHAFHLCPLEEREKLLSAGRKTNQLKLESEFLQKLSNYKENPENKISLWNPGSTGLKSYEVIKSCFAEPCDLEGKNQQGETPLLVAFRARDNTLLPKLIAAGANLEAKDKSNRSIMQIIQSKNFPPDRKKQIEVAINKTIQRKKSGQILSLAVSVGYYNLVNFGISQGEDINQRIGKKNQETLLMIALKNKHLFIAKLLIDLKADVTLKDKQGLSAMERCKDQMSEAMMQALFGQAYKSEEKIVPTLSEKNSSPICFPLCEDKKIITVDKSKDDPSIRVTTKRSVPQLPREIFSTTLSTSNTPPMSNDQSKFSSDRLLLEEQARKIPILSAISNRNIAKLNRLLQEKADVNIHAPGGGKTPLHLAVELNHVAMVDLLIAAKADANAQTMSKITPLHVAAQKGNTVIINKLLDAGATIDAASDVGCTPLHESAAAGHRDAVILLVAKGANTDLKDYRFNLTAYELAGMYHKDNITAILNPDSVNDLIYKPAIEFIQKAFGSKYNQSVQWEIHRTHNNKIYAKANKNFTFEQDAKAYSEKLHAIGLTKAFTKPAQRGWELIVPDLDEVLLDCKLQPKNSQSFECLNVVAK